MLDGPNRLWTDTGQIVLEETFVHGVRIYGDGGQVRFGLRDRALDGPFERREQGRLVARRRYRRGKIDGADERWDDGRLVLRRTYREGVLHGPSFEEEGRTWEGTQVTQGRYCEGHKCGRWTMTFASRTRREETYDAAGQVIDERVWSPDGTLQHHFTKAELDYMERGGAYPLAWRLRKHAECLRELARGNCCEADSDPPPTATVCRNAPLIRPPAP
jgi:hypothetical protein